MKLRYSHLFHIVITAALTLLLPALTTLPLHAQFASGGTPLSSQYSAKLRTNASQRAQWQMTPINEAAIAAQETAFAARSEMRVLPFAITRKLPARMMSAGEVLRTERGTCFWRLRISSPGALSIGLKLERMNIPVGGRLFLYNDRGALRGAFTHLNNGEHGTLNMAPLPGDAITVEYDFPEGTALAADVPFVITELYHDYKGIGSIHAAHMRDYYAGEPWFNSQIESLTCTPNVVDFPGVRNQARSVLLMIVNGNSVCSGALINNTKNDGTPYVLTASHCMNGSFSHKGDVAYRTAAARSTVFFFGFETPVSNLNVRASEEKSLSGAEIVAFDEAADLCLLRIVGMPGGQIPPDYNPYFSGWNAAKNPAGTYMGIHHPRANLKRYNQTDRPIHLGNFEASTIMWKGHHWLIDSWDLGTTAGGSSGSPLFDGKGLIIGALTGGSSTCSNPTNDAYYAITTTWKKSDRANADNMVLAPWLDPDNSGMLQCEGYDPLRKHPITRHSRVIESVYAAQVEALDVTQEQITGVANTMELPADSRVLGFYLVMAPTTKAQETHFPGDSIRLVCQADPESPAKQVFSGLISQPHYFAYNRNTGEMGNYIRLTHQDTIEWYIPVVMKSGERGISLPQGGTYRVSWESADGKSPLALRPMRLPSGLSSSPHALHKNTAGEWVASENDRRPYSGNYWIDVVTQPIHEQGVQPQPSQPQSPVLICSNGHRVDLIIMDTPKAINNKQWAVFELIHMSGKRVLRRSLDTMRSHFDLGGMVTPGVYVARVQLNGKWYSEKISLVY